MDFLFHDRIDAGRQLAGSLLHHAGRPGLLILALPRGGVPVAREIAHVLDAPMDVFVVRKLGVPGQEELAMGAIATGNIRVLNSEVVEGLQIPPEVIEQVTAAEQRELERREAAYRGDRPPPEIQGRRVILADDGLATGATMRAAVAAVRRQQPSFVGVAVPTAAQETSADFENEVDEIVCAATPEPFWGVGRWYADFPQMTDQEVHELLEQTRQDQDQGIA